MEWQKSIFNYLLVAGLVLTIAIFAGGMYMDIYNLSLIVSCASFFLAFSVSLWFYNKKSMKTEEQYILEHDHEYISCVHTHKPAETVKWKEISEIIVITTDKGPQEPYIWIVLSSETGKGCMFPLGAKNSRYVIERLLGFEGFDLSNWSRALHSSTHQRFTVWSRVKAKAGRKTSNS